MDCAKDGPLGAVGPEAQCSERHLGQRTSFRGLLRFCLQGGPRRCGAPRLTLYNQFASKEEIFREMLLRVSRQPEHAFPPGIETQGDVEEVLRLIARVIVDLHKNREYLGFLRMVVADARQFPWIAKEFAAVMDPQTERLPRYLAHLTDLGGILLAKIRQWLLTSSWGSSTSFPCGP